MNEDEKNIIPLPSVEDIEEQAASWLTVLGREDVAAADIADFKKWLRQSDRHRDAFHALSDLWDDLEVLKELEDIAKAMNETREDIKANKPSRRNVFFAIAASIGVVFVGGTSLFFAGEKQAGLTHQAQFVTAVGEQRTIKLTDGSTVQMNTDSQIKVDFSAPVRNIRLLRGEAHFDVAKDTKRPFFVYAANGAVKAVGTAFTVRLRLNDAVEVTVEEGRVALASVVSSPKGSTDQAMVGFIDESRPSIAELTAGQSAVFIEQVEKLAQMQQPEISRKLSWRQGMLAYAGDPLADVIADVSRYTDVTIEIADPSLKNMPIGGYFRVGEVNALLDSLELTFGLDVQHISKTHIRLSASS